MTLQPAGTELAYQVTYLQMETCPGYDWPHLPLGSSAALLKAEEPPTWWFLTLYDAVGRDYAWEDRHAQEPDALRAWLTQGGVALYALLEKGWPQGFFVLEADGPETDLAYFGMVPEAVGKGLGGWLLKTAILTAWSREGIERLTVNTCTLDHPRALALYQRHGFTPVRREDKTRILSRDRDLSRIPQ